VIYCIGDVAFEKRPECDFLIVQDTYLPPFEVDAFLPASSFAEAGGTLVNIEGRVQEVVQVESFPEGAVAGFMRPDWKILSDLAAALECRGLNYQSVGDVRKETSAVVPGFPAEADRAPRRMKALPQPPQIAGSDARAADGDFWLVAEPGGYRHRGIDIASKVGGLCELALEEGFRMHPEDVAALGLTDGDSIRVAWDGEKAEAMAAVKADPECSRGAVYFTRRNIPGGVKGVKEMAPLRQLSGNPARVRIRRAEG
jgi:NADH-quinone oxidoreductase subunit G